MCGGGGNGTFLGAIAGAALAYATGGASLGLEAGTLGAAAAGGAAGAAAGNTLVDQPAKLAEDGIAAQKSATDAAIDAAKGQASQADQAFNKANGKSPDLAGIDAANTLYGKGGQSGTMLTGPQGVDPSTLLLGKKTLLGS